MNEIILPASPNWYLSSILACASNGTAAWAGRHSIVIVKRVKTSDESEKLDYSIIEKAHKDRVTTIAFSPVNKDGSCRLVSGGDDNIVKIWNVNDLGMEMNNMELSHTQKVIAVDWSKSNPNIVCFVSDDGVMIVWDVNFNCSTKIQFGKLTATCLACCPHDESIVAVGSKIGLIYILNVRKTEVIYKLRGHDQEIVSLSWCPVPFNIFQSRNVKDYLLASGAKDKYIYLWKAGIDGRYLDVLKFPSLPLETKNHKSKIRTPTGYQTAVCWLLPTVLLSSSSWGELLMWDLDRSTNKSLSPKLIHSKHMRGLFSIAGISGITNESLDDSSQENWRSKTNIKAIWTVAQDRQVICCSISNGDPSIDCIIPTQGGFIYCMSACQIDTSLIAFGVGDANIRLWHLSEPDTNKLELQVLWDCIKGKVRALSWHPLKENLLAFGTDEGRIGIIDTNTQKSPITCRPYFRSTVYTVGWGPNPNSKDFALYACGDGELAYYPSESFKESPLPVTKKKFCTEFSWKPDDSLLAIGFKDGSIQFLNRDLTEFGHPIHILNKAINCLVWHPDSTSSDLSISSMQNYLAVATNDTAITVLEISSTNLTKKEEQVENSSFYRIAATLNAHSEKVVCLAWSPHMSGYLVSGSYDKTVQVWKVESQEVIASYASHFGPVFCCMWSPFSQDLIITGSADFTLRIWNISNQKILIPLQSKSASKGKRTKKKKINETDTESKQINDESKIVVNDTQIVEVKLNSEDIDNSYNNIDKLAKKKKPKKVTHFPVYAEISNNSKIWCSSVQNLLIALESENQHDEFDAYDFKEIEDEKNESEKLNEDIPFLMGSKKNLEDSLLYEKKKLSLNGQTTVVTEMSLWSDNLKENLLEAEKNKCLSDFLVSLAPSVSIEMWERMCESFAVQLMPEYPHRAVSYLLCIKKLDKAIDVFVTSKCYKEAYVLASTRLESTNSIITNILQEWAKYGEKVGNFKESAECYIKLGEYQKAAMILAGRKDLYSLYLAIKLAKVSKDFILFESLTERALFIALTNLNIKIAQSITKRCPKLKCRELEVLIFDEIAKTLLSNTDEKIFNWLKGSSDIDILDKFKKLYASCPEKYSLLLQKNELTLPGSDKILQLSVSHELALSILSDHQQQKLEHIVKACDCILQNEKNDSTNLDEKHSLLINYLSILDSKSWMDSSSIFNKNENNISKSLGAYLCYSTIQWFLINKLTDSKIVECENLVTAVLEKYLENLLDKDSVKFWTTTNTISKLESQLSLSIGKVEEEADETQLLIEKIETMKNDRMEFIKSRVSSPNPLSSYVELMKVIDKISNEDIRKQMTTLITDTWSKAIS